MSSNPGRACTAFAVAHAAAAAARTGAAAAAFTWSTQSEPTTMDPHIAAAPVLGCLNHNPLFVSGPSTG